jgi:lysophospholipase L1-like esterase
MIVLVIIVEIILRIYFPVSDPYDRFKNRFDQSFIPSDMPAGARYELSSREGLPYMDSMVVYTTNNVGFRGDSISLKKPAGEVRIFIVGGSTAQCLYIDDSKSINSVLQNELQNEVRDKSIKVFVAAKSGDASDEHLSMIAHRIIHLEPDIIIVFSGINDLRKTVQRYDYAHLQKRKLYSPRYIYLALTDFQVSRRLYYLFKKPSDDEMRESVPLETNYNQLFAIQQKTPESDSVPYINAHPYAVNLRSIAGVCAENNVKLMFMPNQSTWNSSDDTNMLQKHWLLTCGQVRYREQHLDEGLNTFNDSMRQVCVDNKIPIFDLPAMIPKTSEFFYDDCHFTARGSAISGKMLARYIINNNLLKRDTSVSTFKYK